MSSNKKAGYSILIGIIFPTLFGLLSPVSVFCELYVQADFRDENKRLLLNDIEQKTGLKVAVKEGERFSVVKESQESANHSPTLRTFIKEVIKDEGNRFYLRDTAGSSKTLFGYTDAGTHEIHTGEMRYLVDLDFSDLRNSKRYSSKLSIEAFSPAIILFHEIDHKVSYDKDDPIPTKGVRLDHSHDNHVGVIERTNRIRKELGLPLRVATVPLLKKYRGPISSFRNTIEIPFEDSDGKRFFLRFKLTR